ncbi:MAG: cache domain-containing protein [Deltaproteobacteria bacterium]|nr:cache domain-containing protein [Deltaproteobacteria bacterium]
MKLSKKIALYFGGFIIVVVAVFMALNYIIVQQSLERNAHVNLKRSVESISSATQSMLNASIRSYLRGIVHQDVIRLKSLNDDVQKGVMTLPEAQDAFQEYVSGRSIGKSGYIVAVNEQNKKLFLAIHPYMRGEDCTDIEGCRIWDRQKSGYTEYNWRNPKDQSVRKKVAYLEYFEPWDWVVGATSYKDEFTELTRIDDLKRTIGQFKVLDRGYFFVLDDKLNMLIHPELEGQSMKNFRNSDGVFVAREMIRHEGDFYYYRLKTAHEKQSQQRFSYVKKLNDLNWYLAATGYVDDIRKPMHQLAQWGYVLILSVTLLLGVLITVFSRQLTRPLTLLLQGIRDFNMERKLFQMPMRSVLEVNQLCAEVEATTRSLLSSEKQIQTLLTELNSIINSLPSILAVVDTHKTVEFWNEQAEKFTGIPAVWAIGQPVSQVLSPFKSEMTFLETHIASPKMSKKNCRLESGDGRIQYFEIATYPLPRELSATIIRIDDITERTRLEETLQQTRKMDAIGNLAGGIAHDFNNMLTGILTSAQLLENRTDNSEKALRSVKIIYETALRAAGLTQNLLTFSRKQVRKAEPLHVHATIKDAVNLLTRSIDKRIAITTELTSSADVIIGDYAEMQSVFLNLGVNASHAMMDGGELTFRTELRTIDASTAPASTPLPAGDYIVIDVTDTGVGIPEQLLDKVFEPFFTTKETGKGTGLGLASVYATVTRQKGDISIASKLAQGTRVTIRLPLETETVKKITAKSESRLIQGTGTILVVEDEEIIREIASQALSQMGYTVMLADNGAKGLDVFKQHWRDIDLVLLDMIMPVMGGKECFEKMKQINPKVRVIVASGFSKNDELTTMQDTDDFKYIAKPYSIGALSRLVADVLQMPAKGE